MSWTEPKAVVAKLRRRWDSGALLRAYAESQAWEPFSVALSGPRPGEISGDVIAVRDWVAVWEKACATGRPIRLERHTVGGRLVGRNELPVRAHVDGYAEAWKLLGVRDDVDDFDQIVAQTTDARLALWVNAHPLKALAARVVWPALLATVEWIQTNQGDGLYLRQIEVPGADTKFVEAHRGLLADLLAEVLPPERINLATPVSDFARRFGFAAKPEYVRFRYLDRAITPGAYSDMSVRADELAAAPPEGSTVFIVENEITYLALPPVADSLVIFGSGYSVGRLRDQHWLEERDVYYWGDIDTHGFAILNQLRATFPRVHSVLMDRETLLAHRMHWTTEPKQHPGRLANLTPAESELHGELLGDVHGLAVRLEQERIPFSSLPPVQVSSGFIPSL